MEAAEVNLGTELEADRPSAGVPCTVCEAGGHFCQADQFVAGDSGKGICTYCLSGEDCATYKAQRQNADEALSRFDAAPGPVVSQPVQREHPVGSWSRKRDEEKQAKARELLRLGASVTRVMKEAGLSYSTVVRIRKDMHDLAQDQPAEQPTKAKHDFSRIMTRLVGLMPGETVSFIPPVGMRMAEFQRQLEQELAGDTRTRDCKWYMHPDESGLRLVVATTSAIGKHGVSVQRMPVKTKVTRRQQAEFRNTAMERVERHFATTQPAQVAAQAAAQLRTEETLPALRPHYEMVIADFEAQRDKISRAIDALRACVAVGCFRASADVVSSANGR